MPTIPDDYAVQFDNTLVFLSRLASGRITPLIEKQLLMMLPTSIPFYSHLVMRDHFPQVERLTINKNVQGSNKRIKEIKLLKYPPADKVKNYGRCNLKNQSVLYGSFDMMTVLSELKPRIGDLITFTTWQAKPETQLRFCPIFKNQPKKKDFINPRLIEIEEAYNRKVMQYSPTVRIVIDHLISFVCNAFTRYVQPGNNSDYLVSAYFSNLILYEFENGTIDAIYYPSVQQDLSLENIAIKPSTFDKVFTLTKVKESIVINDPTTGSKGTMMQSIRECECFDFDNDKILWDRGSERIPQEMLTMFSRRFDLKLD